MVKHDDNYTQSHLQVTGCVQQNVAGFQVPMKHISRVYVLQSTQNLINEVSDVVIA